MFLGTQANSLNFQLYLLEGLSRWNRDRAEASVSGKPSSFMTYSGALLQCINTSSVKVLGRKYIHTFQPPAQYTGNCDLSSKEVFHSISEYCCHFIEYKLRSE